MEWPKVEDLTPAEKKARIRISSDDYGEYPEWFYWPFERILRYTTDLIVPTSPEMTEFKESNFDFRYWGYCDWGSPPYGEGLCRLMRVMTSQFIYRDLGDGAISDDPDIQMQKLFAAPLTRALKERTKTTEHRQLQQKIFVMKFSLAPFMTSNVENIQKHYEKQVRVWRLISCYGETNLDTLHDRILGPSMGWTRHYHSYKFVVPTNGACFGPKDSGAIDMMHSHSTYTLDARKFQLCHVLREPGQKLVYVYDLGDQWVHNIELIQVADKGDFLEIPLSDEQVKEALLKQYDGKLPELFGVQLFAGEMNCPPEDSVGCNGMGLYGNIVKKGPKHKSHEAATAQNWSAHGIKNAYTFNLAAHAQRLSDAISGKSSARTGQKVMSIPLGDPATFRKGPRNNNKPGEKVREGCVCCPMTETIKTRPDKADEAVCTTCGRQPSIEKGKKTSLLRCSGCKGAWYCGKDCQMSDWKNHKGRCRAMKKERIAYKREQAELKGETVD